MQWRAGWGFRPHFNIIQQQNAFSHPGNRELLKPFTGGFGETFLGYQWSAEARGEDFVFNPPPFIITGVGIDALWMRRRAISSGSTLLSATPSGKSWVARA